MSSFRLLCNSHDTVSQNCNNEDMCNTGNINDPCDTPSVLNKFKLKSKSRLVTGHLNINSLPGKFGQLKLIIGKNIDILVITKTKIYSSFPRSEFIIDEFSMPYRFDRNRLGRGVIDHVCDDIPSKKLHDFFYKQSFFSTQPQCCLTFS